MLKTVLIVFLVLAAVAVAGGSYYYFEIYLPEKYAGEVMPFYQKLESSGLEPDASPLANATDYESAASVLNERIALLNSIKRDLAVIETPKRMQNYQKEFTEYIDFLLSRHEHALGLAAFLKSASKLHTSIQTIYGGNTDRDKVKTIGDFIKLWDDNLAGVKSSARDMFAKEIKELEKPSYAQLETLWKNSSPGFDFVLGKIKKVDPKLPLEKADNVFTPAEHEKLNLYSKNIEEFLKGLEALTKKYSAYDILAFKYFPDATPTESSERALKFYGAMRELKQKFSK